MTEGLYFILIWYSGCCLGSFLMVLGLRFPQHLSIITPRSHCTTCKKSLSFWQLFPIFSFLFQRGRCHFCQAPLSCLYLLIELFTGFGYLISFLSFNHNRAYLIGALLLFTFAAIFIVSDCFYFILPNSVMVTFFLVIFLFRLSELYFSFIGGVTLTFLLLFISFLFPNGMGGGDIKLVGVIGWLLGAELGLLALVIACIVALSYFMLLFIWQKNIKTKQIPFAPFIFIGAISIYFIAF